MGRVVGVTGGIGSGKSVLSRLLRCRGYVVYDCDSEAKRIMDSSDALKDEIRETLGEVCVDASGALCRREIALVIFADESARLWLNSRVHALVRGDLERRLRDAAGERIFFVESAILHSSGLDAYCDRIWLVDAPLPLRVERVMGRDGAGKEEVMARIAAQAQEYDALPQDKVRIVANDGFSSLTQRVDELLETDDIK